MICDVSKYQGAVDWDRLAPQLDFVIIKASGKTKDSCFDRNAAEATRRGVPWHAYHFLYCTTEAGARVEAKLFSDSVGAYEPLFWVLDCEGAWGVAKGKARAVAEAFEAELRRLRGDNIRVAVYIGHNVYKDYALDYGRYAYVWIPRYGKNDGTEAGSTRPNYPCDIWQYTSKGRLLGISGDVDLDVLTGTKPLEYFTGANTNGGEDMAINYDKYILSTGTHYISNSGQDENKGYHGGAAGDQTGHEWELKAWYNRPWSVVLRYPDQAVALKIAQLGIAAALNDKIGYDQWQRTTYWTQLEKAGYDPSRITTACEEDCTAGVTANVKAAGYLMGIKALQDLAIDTYSGNMKSRFVAAGFKALTASKYIAGSAYLLPGDILLYEGHHAATNITCGKSVRDEWHPDGAESPATPAEPQPEGLSKGDYGAAVTAMQKALLAWNPDCLPRYGADGDFGSETESAVKAFQTAAGVPVTGVFDDVTRNALAAANAPDDDGKAGLPQYVVITGGSVNVRSAPGTNSKVLGVVYKGDRLPYQGEKSAVDGRDWYLVDYKNQNAWVSSKYSRVE